MPSQSQSDGSQSSCRDSLYVFKQNRLSFYSCSSFFLPAFHPFHYFSFFHLSVWVSYFFGCFISFSFFSLSFVFNIVCCSFWSFPPFSELLSFFSPSFLFLNVFPSLSFFLHNRQFPLCTHSQNHFHLPEETENRTDFQVRWKGEEEELDELWSPSLTFRAVEVNKLKSVFSLWADEALALIGRCRRANRAFMWSFCLKVMKGTNIWS